MSSNSKKELQKLRGEERKKQITWDWLKNTKVSNILNHISSVYSSQYCI
jgi:hypothetical protein